MAALPCGAQHREAQGLEIANVQYYGWAFENRAALMPTEAQVRDDVSGADSASYFPGDPRSIFAGIRWRY